VDDKEKLKLVEEALSQMLKPVKNIPFSVIVKSLSERQVIQIDKTDPADAELLKNIESAI
jgi:hypothetical protein